MFDSQEEYPNLKDATYLSFQVCDKSLAAKAFTQTIASSLSALEERLRSRSKKSLEAFKVTTGLILAGLMCAAQRKEHGWVYRSFGNDTFMDAPVTADNFRRVMSLLEQAGYIERAAGSNRSNRFYTGGEQCKAFNPGLSTRIRATEALIEIAMNHNVSIDRCDYHYIRKLPTKVIKKRAASSVRKGQKTPGRQIKIVHDSISLRLQRQTQEINEYLNRQDLEGATFEGYHRIFNLGDQPDFYWNKGGRLNCLGPDSYQRMKKQQRLQTIRINGQPAVEVDINASYLTIFHGVRGEALPSRDDIYQVEGLHRDIVKAWVTSAFGSGTFPSRWPVYAKRELLDKGIIVGSLTMKQVGQMTCEAIPVLRQLPSSGISWADLMYLESEAVIAAMESLRERHDVPAYSMHDGLLVAQGAANLAARELVQAFENQGLECRVKIKTA